MHKKLHTNDGSTFRNSYCLAKSRLQNTINVVCKNLTRLDGRKKTNLKWQIQVED